MRNAMRFITVLPLVLATVSIAMAEKEADRVSSLVKRLGQEAVDTGKTVGLSIAVAQGDEITVAQGFGLANVELNVKATRDTVYRIGSITKEFTAVAVLLLVEDGKIDLDEPVTKYLPEYPKHGSRVKIRHLLNHTSGIADFTRLPEYRKNRPLDVSQAEVLNRFQGLPLEFSPGEKHRYCNSGYFLLGVIVEKVSGKTFREFVEQRLFFKLGLQKTFCDSNSRIIPNRASGYSAWGGKLKNASFINLRQTIGAGNLASTVTDLVIWQRGLVKHRVLQPESIRRMTTRGELKNGRSFSYGFGVRVTKLAGRLAIRHGGGISGFRADLAYYPDNEMAITVLANSDSFNPTKLSDRIATTIIRSSSKQDD